MQDLSGRVGLVTGASSGLGEEFARTMSRAGAKVVLGARRLDRVETIAAELETEGHIALAVALDVTDEASVSAAFDEAEDHFGTVDTVVCNAGAGVGGRSTDIPVAGLKQVQDTNLLGAFLTAREGARRMIAADLRESERGRIVLIGSITAQQFHTGDAMYAATKAGIAHLGRNLAKEWVRQGINVNTLQPGWVKTEMNADWFDGKESGPAIQALPRRRVMPVDALIEPLLFLCSDASRHVTGAALTIDDGMSL